MADVQPEKGWFKVVNDLADAYSRCPLLGQKARVLWFVLRESYGRKGNKFAETQSTRDIARRLRMDQGDVSRALTGLIRCGLIKKTEQGWLVVKDYEQWCEKAVDKPVENQALGKHHRWGNTIKTMGKHHQNDGETPSDINKVVKDRKTERHTAPAPTPRGAERAPLPNPDIKLLIDEYFMTLKAKLKEHPTSFNGGAAAKGFSRLLKSFPRYDIQSRFNNWFQSTDTHIARRGWRAEDFFTYYNQLRDGPILVHAMQRRSDEDKENDYKNELEKRRKLNEHIKTIMGQ